MDTNSSFKLHPTILPRAGPVSNRGAVEGWQRFVPVALTVVVALLTACHVYYILNSGMVPSTDEAHYMSGALSIASGIRSGAWSGAWHGYVAALGFKAPLICVPAALFMLIGGGLETPCMLSLCATFAALGYASYRLFRRCAEPVIAATATILLLTTPMVTGFTHRLYAEFLLILVSVAYVAVLARNPWMSRRWSVAAGLVLGLGVLTKVTFLLILALPTAWSVAVALWPWNGLRRRLPRVLAGVILALVVAIGVAGPWYRYNLASVLHHAKLGVISTSYYANWVVAYISCGPGVVVWLLAVFGLVVLARAAYRRELQWPELNACILVGLLGLSTALAITSTPNKQARFQATWLPAYALLAAAGLAYAVPRRARLGAMTGLALFGIAFSLHVSLDFLPSPAIRLGDFRPWDNRFPLNIPDSYDDNHPLDRRVVPMAKVVLLIAQDAGERLRNGERIHARTTELGLLVNFDYLSLLSAERRDNVEYLPSWLDKPTGPDAPDYIVRTQGLHALYPGAHFFEYYPTVDADVASGRIPYRLLARFDGPEGSAVLVYRKPVPTPVAGTRLSQNAISIEAASFVRGTAVVERSTDGNGKETGIIADATLPVSVEYEFEATGGGIYQIDVHYASPEPRPVRLTMDGRLITKRAAEAVTGGFDIAHRQWRPAAVLCLSRGRHIMRLDSDWPLPHINRFSITRLFDENMMQQNSHIMLPEVFQGTWLARTSFAAVLASAAMVSCSPPPTSSPLEGPPAEANGPTRSLQRTAGAPLYSLEEVAGASPFAQSPVAVPLAGQFTATGWAVDGASHDPARGVDITIDDKPYAAEYGMNRTDVSEHYKVPAYSKSGFKLSIPAAAIGKGRHRLVVRVIESGGMRYREGDPLGFEVQ